MIRDLSTPQHLLETRIDEHPGAPGEYMITHRLSDGSVRLVGSITFQQGPIREVGLNGCQVDDVLQACTKRLASFGEPDIWTSRAIAYVKLALLALEGRTLDRAERGVEGTAQP